MTSGRNLLTPDKGSRVHHKVKLNNACPSLHMSYMTSTLPVKVTFMIINSMSERQSLGADAVLALNPPNVPRSAHVGKNKQQHVFTIKSEEGRKKEKART